MSPPIGPFRQGSESDVAARSQNASRCVGRSLPGPEEQVRRADQAHHLDACTHADLPLCSAAVSHSVTSFVAAGDAAARPRPCRSSGDTEQLGMKARRSCCPSGLLPPCTTEVARRQQD